MANNIVPRKRIWTRQPQIQVGIDRSNYLARHIGAIWNFADDVEPISGLVATTGPNSSRGLNEFGRYVNVTLQANLNRYICKSTRDAIDIGSGDFSVWVKFTYLGYVGGYSIFGRWNTGSTPSTSDWFLGAPSGFSGTSVGFSVATATSIYSASAVGSWVVGKTYTLIGRRKGTTIFVDRYCHDDGVWVSGSTTDSGITTINYNSARNTKLGEIDVGKSYNAAANYYLAGTSKQCFSDDGLRELVSNPWQIFKPRTRYLFTTSVEVSASYTITPTGSLVLSGATSQIREKIFSCSGTVTYTGSNNLILSQGATEYNISPTGTITYSGTYPVRRIKQWNPSGVITYSGTASWIKNKVQIPHGDITFNGSASLYVPGSYIPTTSILLTGVGK